MSKFFITIITIFLSFLILFFSWQFIDKTIQLNMADLPTQETFQGEEAIIGRINKQVQRINGYDNYEIKILDNEWFVDQGIMLDGGMQLEGFYKADELHKMKVWAGLSFDVRKTEYYFSDGQLILIHEVNEIFPPADETGTLDFTRLEKVFEGYYYFDDAKLVAKQTFGEKRFLFNDEVNLEQELLEGLKYNLDFLEPQR